MKIIDIHSHFFNLKYLPVAGIIMRYADGKVSRPIAKGVEWLLLKYTRSDFETEDLSRELAAPKAFRVLGKESERRGMKDVFGFSPEETATAISNLAATTDLLQPNPLTDALKDFEAQQADGPEEIPLDPQDHLSREMRGLDRLFERLKRMLNWLMEKVKALRNYLKWFFFMTHSEQELYAYLRDVDSSGVQHFVHQMMDVDAFFNEPTGSTGYASYFDFVEQQIPNMQELNARFGGKLTGFVAFNPSRENGLEIVKEAIEQRGFKGVKFYPPLGYRGWGDPNYAARIEALIRYCSERRVPLFAHCNNQGFEARPNGGHSGYNSNPVFWEKALEHYPDLILCLAHGGGVEGWFTANRDSDLSDPQQIKATAIADESEQQRDWNKSYAAMVYKLCVSHPHVYCDAAYLDEMVNSDGSFEEEARKNFKQRLLKLFVAQPAFSKKIMYGSDWHMLFQEAKNHVYLKNYITFYADPEFDSYREDFFCNNACRYLGMNAV